MYHLYNRLLTGWFWPIIVDLIRMNTRARSRILPHIILTMLVCALAVAATTRPLSRTRLGLAPQLNQIHQGLERHTYFEVAADGAHHHAVYDLLVRSNLPLIALAQQQSSKLVSTRQQDNWPVLFSPLYRHIPRADQGDPGLSA